VPGVSTTEALMKLFDVIIHFDQRVLDSIEKFCHKTQRAIGWTNFTWLKLAWGLLGFTTGIIPMFFKDSLGISFAEQLWFMGIFTISLGTLGSWMAAAMEETSKESLAKGLANPLKEVFAAVTICRVFFIVLALTGGPAIYLMGLTSLIITYLMQCNPLSPCDSKLKQWFQSLFLTPIPLRSGE